MYLLDHSFICVLEVPLTLELGEPSVEGKQEQMYISNHLLGWFKNRPRRRRKGRSPSFKVLELFCVANIFVRLILSHTCDITKHSLGGEAA